MTQEEIGSLNKTLRSKAIKSAIKKFPTKKGPGPYGFTSKSKEELTPKTCTFI